MKRIYRNILIEKANKILRKKFRIKAIYNKYYIKARFWKNRYF